VSVYIFNWNNYLSPRNNFNW